MTQIQESVGDVLDREMHRLQISQEELGNRLGVTQQAISGWKKANAIPKARWEQLQEIFGPESPLLTNAEKWAHERQQFNRSFNPGRSVENLRQYAHVLRQAVTEPRMPLKRPEGSEAVQQLHRQVIREDGFRTRFFAALPQELSRYREANIEIGATVRRLDYLSDRVGLELIPARMPQALSTHVAGSIVRLAVVRAATRHTHPNRQYVLAIHVPDDAIIHPRQMQRTATDCSLLGIEMIYSPSPETLAHHIKLLEFSSEGSTELELEDEIDDNALPKPDSEV